MATMREAAEELYWLYRTLLDQGCTREEAYAEVADTVYRDIMEGTEDE